jgi:hypothetical protein
MNSNRNLGLLVGSTHFACTEFVKSGSHDDIRTLAQLAQDGLYMSPDELNNLIYGRVDITDTFLLKLYDILSDYAPEICGKWLNRFFRSDKIIVGNTPKPNSMTEREFKTVIHSLLNELSGLANMHVIHLEDDDLDEKEIDSELRVIERLHYLLRQYEYALQLRKASRFATAHQLSLGVANA